MKRFYQRAESAKRASGYAITLDGKPIRTPGKRDLLVPSEALAAAIAEEWNAQATEVRAAEMPLTHFATTTFDRGATQRDATGRQRAEFSGTELRCYRATRRPELAARQQAVWQPLIDWAV